MLTIHLQKLPCSELVAFYPGKEPKPTYLMNQDHETNQMKDVARTTQFDECEEANQSNQSHH